MFLNIFQAGKIFFASLPGRGALFPTLESLSYLVVFITNLTAMHLVILYDHLIAVYMECTFETDKFQPCAHAAVIHPIVALHYRVGSRGFVDAYLETRISIEHQKFSPAGSS